MAKAHLLAEELGGGGESWAPGTPRNLGAAERTQPAIREAWDQGKRCLGNEGVQVQFLPPTLQLTNTPSGCASLCTCPPADESLHPPVQQEVILPVGSRVVLLEPKALATFSLITFY